ncbi:MAG: PilN domain-containing protein [Gammaproteobacteria bacterium]|nr:PilN domain-containing protein [Gammaproteobacteria bacterium]
MKYLAKLQDHLADIQDLRILGAAKDVLVLDRGRLFSIDKATDVECEDTSLDAIVYAALSLGLEASSGIILLLPPEHFSTSEHGFSKLQRGALLQALRFQQDEIFPGMEPLMVTAACSPGSSLALWMRRSEFERWRHAFAMGGLKLLALGPRSLLRQYLGQKGFSAIDEETMLEVTVDPRGDLTRWVMQEDSGSEQNQERDPVSNFWAQFQKQWRIRRSDYLFKPERKETKSRLGLWLVATVLVVGLLVTFAVMPIVQQLARRAELEQQVAELTQRSADVLNLREEVLDLEARLAPVLSYPETSISSLLALLDRFIPKGSWLTSIRMTESVVEIDGISPNPPQIIEQLSVRPEFSEVAFSKAIQQDLRTGLGEERSRFGIRLKLAGIDFEGWRRSVRKEDE